MATIDIGKLTFTHKGDYAGGTAYVANDVVYYNGSAYIAKTSTTGNLPTSTAHWNLFSAGSGGIWNSGLSLGSAGEAVKVNSGASALEFGTISSGTYSVHAFDEYTYINGISVSSQSNYHDIAGGNTVSFQPTSTNDIIFFNYYNSTYQANNDSGVCTYLMMKENSSSIGSGDTMLDFAGQHLFYTDASSHYIGISKSFILPCTGLNTSSTYYVEQAGATHSSNSTDFNRTNNAGGTGTYRTHFVQLIHYKRN